MAIQYDPSLSALMDFFCEGAHQGFPEADVQAAEARLGVALPPRYRAFLLAYGGDAVNSHFNQISEPEQICTTYEILEEELPEWEPEFQKALRDGTEARYEDNDYFRLWRLPKDRWGEVTDNYVLIWFENQGVWSAGWRLEDLLAGVPDPPVYMSTEDDYVTYQKVTEGIEDFLFEMLREAAHGWHGAPRLTGCQEIRDALAGAGVDPEALRPRGQASGNGGLAVFLDAEREQAGFCFAAEDYQELCLVSRSRPQKRPSASRPAALRTSSGIQYRPPGRGPYRLELTPAQKLDLGMDRPKPENGVALHPLIALLVQETFQHTPSTAYDWDRDLSRVKSLKLELRWGTRQSLEEDGNTAYLCPPGGHAPPPPYYFDLRDWSVIRRMTALRTFFLSRILVEDDGFWPALAQLPSLRSLSVNSTRVGSFAFLRECTRLTHLSLYNTDFADCRLLLDLPGLQEADLRFCSLEHTEALRGLDCKCLL